MALWYGLVDAVNKGDFLEVLPQGQVQGLVALLLGIVEQMEEMFYEPQWPLNMEQFKHVAAMEAVLKAAVQGGTEFVNYGTLNLPLTKRLSCK